MHIDHLTTEVVWTLAAVVGLLVVSSALVFGLKKRTPDQDHTELIQRVKTWWVIVALFGGSLLLTRQAVLWFFGFVSFLALKEFFSLIPSRRADRRALFWAYLSIPFQYYWISLEWYGMFIIFIPVYLFLFIPARLVLIGETEGFLRSVETIHWGAMITVFGLSHAAYLTCLSPVEAPRIAYSWPNSGATQYLGPGLLLMLVLLTELNDIAQYVWGKSFGRRKVAPHVSPGKTWAGLLGGVATTVVLASLIGPWLTPLDLTRSVLAGLIIGVAGFFGDLSISAIKRDLQVKDSGSMLPGHGGILDRIDSLTYTAPLFFHFVYFYYF